MPKPVSLPIKCVHCGAALRLDVANWSPDVYAQRTAHDYRCPACQKLQTVTLPGTVVQVRSA